MVTWLLFPEVTETGRIQCVRNEDFATHEKCSVHKMAVEVIVTLPVTTRYINEILSTAQTNEKVVN